MNLLSKILFTIAMIFVPVGVIMTKLWDDPGSKVMTYAIAVILVIGFGSLYGGMISIIWSV